MSIAAQRHSPIPRGVPGLALGLGEARADVPAPSGRTPRGQTPAALNLEELNMSEEELGRGRRAMRPSPAVRVLGFPRFQTGDPSRQRIWEGSLDFHECRPLRVRCSLE